MQQEVDRILHVAEVLAATGFSRATLYARVSKGQFPRPLKIGPSRIGFLASEVIAWQKSRERSTPGHFGNQSAKKASNGGWRS
jgi:prophage regulatory protein